MRSVPFGPPSIGPKLKEIIEREDANLSEFATKSSEAIGHGGDDNFLRTPFGIDIDRIMHSPFYNRYVDKTQVFSFYKNDDITRRALHVQLVSRIARIIGKALSLNLDLIEAIALGHDIGHTPFGHKGEKYLSEISFEKSGKFFNHNVHSVKVLKDISGQKLTLQTLNGILCHNGEKLCGEYHPAPKLTAEEFEEVFKSCYTGESEEENRKKLDSLKPFTLEGCVVRISDMIAYVGKDRQDAYKAGLRIEEFKSSNAGFLGKNSAAIKNLTFNIVKNSIGKPYIKLDKDVEDELRRVKDENSRLIYQDKNVGEPYEKCIKPMMQLVFDELVGDYRSNVNNSHIYVYYMNALYTDNSKSNYYLENGNLRSETNIFDVVVDYIASMTDDYFIDLFKKMFPNNPLNQEIKYKEYFAETNS
jgi:dGTP triphosphohydrolase